MYLRIMSLLLVGNKFIWFIYMKAGRIFYKVIPISYTIDHYTLNNGTEPKIVT